MQIIQNFPFDNLENFYRTILKVTYDGNNSITVIASNWNDVFQIDPIDLCSLMGKLHGEVSCKEQILGYYKTNNNGEVPVYFRQLDCIALMQKIESCRGQIAATKLGIL